MSTTGNWDPPTALVAGDSYQWVFQGSSQTRPIFNADYGVTTVILSNNLIASWQANGNSRTLRLGSFFWRQAPAVANTVYFASPYLADVYLADADSGSATTFTCETGGRVDFHGTIHNGAGTSSALIKEGAGVLQLGGNGDNDWTGGTVVNGGRLQLFKSAQNLNALPAGGAVTVNNSADISLNQWHVIADDVTITLNDSSMFRSVGISETLEAIQSTSASTRIDLGNRAADLGQWILILRPSAAKTYNGGTGVAEFHGTVQGGPYCSQIAKDGDGTLVLAGNNIYSNKTTVLNGTLKLNGLSGYGAVQVNSGATLLAKSTITGPVTVDAGGSVGAGFSPGTLALPGGLSLDGTNIWELGAYDDSPGGAGTSYDQIQMSGSTLTLGGSSQLLIGFLSPVTNPNGGNAFWSSAHSWNVITGAGSVSGTLPVANGTYAAGTFSATVSSGNVVLNYTPSGAPAAARPRITSITGAGTSSIVVNYTNTVPTKTYYLRYKTSITGNWTTNPPGGKVAAGYFDSQTDTPVSGAQRYYQVWYVNP